MDQILLLSCSQSLSLVIETAMITNVYTTVRAAEQEVAYRALRRGIMDFERRQFYRGPEAWVDLPADKAALFRNDLIGLFDRYVTPADGKVRWGREYLITIATRR